MIFIYSFFLSEINCDNIITVYNRVGTLKTPFVPNRTSSYEFLHVSTDIQGCQNVPVTSNIASYFEVFTG